MGDLFFGIDVLDVQEVLYQADVTEVPRAADAVRGLINLRGQIATTIDLRCRLGLERAPADLRSTHVVVRSGGEAVSLLVDVIGDVLDVDPGRFEPSPETMTETAAALIAGAYKLEGELLLVLDVRRALDVANPDREEI